MKPFRARKILDHHVPDWVDAHTAIYFLTACACARGTNSFCHKDLASYLFESIRIRNEKGLWFMHLFLLMPDHVHGLVSFPVSGGSMQKVVGSWKSWTAKQYGIQWQKGFFDHRLRTEESISEKSDYILNNPVRAGLAHEQDEWPYVWMPERTARRSVPTL